MIFFTLSIVLLLAIYILSRRVPLARRFASVLLLFGLCGVAIWVLDAEVSVRAESERQWYETSPYKQIVVLVFMLLGMAGKYLFDAIDARRKRKQSGDSTVRLDFDWLDFIQPFIVAFIVFGSFWQAHGEEALTVTWLVISFQNGFFWQTILSKSS